MEITVKLFATFRDGRDKKQILQLDESKTPEDIIPVLGIEKSTVSILLINGIPAKFDNSLTDGDLISLFPALGGG